MAFDQLTNTEEEDDPEDSPQIAEDEAPAKKPRKTDRDQELSGRKRILDRLEEVFADVQKGFQDQRDRSDALVDNWDAYNCKLGVKQVYTGNSETFVPIIADAVDARRTRFVNQMFPLSGRNVEVVSTDGDRPDSIVSLMEHYIQACKLRTQVAPALCVGGDVDGQYNLYVGWKKTKRHVARRVTKPVEVDGVEIDEEYEDMEEETLLVQLPDPQVISDADVLILPVTCDSVEDALAMGGSVTIKRRWSKGQIKAMAKDGEITQAAADNLADTMSKAPTTGRNLRKKQVEAIGIKSGGTGKYAEGYETWTVLKVDGEERLCVARYAGEVLGCKLNPYWSDLCPLISVPVAKVAGLAKGIAPVTKVLPLQCFANDMANAGADTAYYSAMPIIARDPQGSPAPLILGLAAIWNISPEAVKFMQFPALWKDSEALVASIKQQIFQSLGVNPAMMPQSTGGKVKRNQAEIAQEQQVDMLTTADAVTGMEEGVLTPFLERVLWYDHQFRDEALTVRQYGEMGIRAKMDKIPPVQMNARYTFRWLGAEMARNAAANQQKMAGLNMLRAIPPSSLPGKRIDLSAAIIEFVQTTFGPRIAPLTIVDQKYEQTLPPDVENEMLEEGFDLAVHAGDDDPKHIQSHLGAMKAKGDPAGTMRSHIQKHQMQMQAKAMNAHQQQQPQQPGQGGPPGGQPSQPGSAPQGQRPMRGPPGMINPDRMSAAGAPGMPRKT